MTNESFDRIEDWLRSLKRSLSYNGEWEQEDDEVSKLILEICSPAVKSARTRMLREALLRAYADHGHQYNCSAARGPHSDCTCGWLEVMELVKQIRGER